MPTIGMSKHAWHRHQEQLKRHEPFHDFEFTRIAESGELRVVSVSGEPVFDAAGAFTGYRGAGSDVTTSRRIEAQLRELATIDALTGVANRREFLAHLHHQYARQQRNPHEQCAVLMLHGDEAHYLSASIGVGLMCATDPTSSAALSRADEAMYRAKKAGCNRVEAQAAGDRARAGRFAPRSRGEHPPEREGMRQ